MASDQRAAAADLIWELVRAFHPRYGPSGQPRQLVNRNAARRMLRAVGRSYALQPGLTIKTHLRAASLGFYGFQVRSLAGSTLRALGGGRVAGKIRRILEPRAA